MPNEILNWLKKYLEETPKKEIKREWEAIGDIGTSGPRLLDMMEELSRITAKEQTNS